MFLAIYIMELVLKLYVWRIRYFKIGWNVFDCIIVAASFVDFLIPLIVQNFGAFDTKVFRVFKVFRAVKALKALRVLRTIRFLKNLQIIVATVLRSIPALGNIVLLISLVLYVFAVIGRGLYAEVDPARFGNLGVACYTLFQLLTLDDWYFMYSDVASKYPDHKHIFVYLLLFIVLETFIFINLFVAVIVDNLEQTQAAASSGKAKKKFGHKHHHDQDSDTDIAEDNSRKTDKNVAGKESQGLQIEEYYGTDDCTDRERELRAQYFSILSSLEHHLHLRRQHHQTMEELIDLVDFAKN
jgi:cation channel sperm-associated protein 1